MMSEAEFFAGITGSPNDLALTLLAFLSHLKRIATKEAATY